MFSIYIFRGQGRLIVQWISIVLLACNLFITKNLYSSDDSNTGFFLRGDALHDHVVNLGDPIAILLYLYAGGDRPSNLDAADADDNGKVEMADALYLLNFLFLGGPRPAEPFPDPGIDITVDTLEPPRLPSVLPSPILGSELTTAVIIDGVFGADEWRDADVRQIYKDDHRNIKLYIKNSPSSLYVGLLSLGDFEPSDIESSLLVGFGAKPGNQASLYAHEKLWDLHAVKRSQRNFAIPGLPDIGSWEDDENAGGTIDGTAAFTFSNHRLVTYEFQIPLNSGDSNDLATQIGDLNEFFVHYVDHQDHDDHSHEFSVTWPHNSQLGSEGHLAIRGNLIRSKLEQFKASVEKLTLQNFSRRGVSRLVATQRLEEIQTELATMVNLMLRGDPDRATEIYELYLNHISTWSADGWFNPESPTSDLFVHIYAELIAIFPRGHTGESCERDGSVVYPGFKNGKFYYFEENFENITRFEDNNPDSGWSVSGLWRYIQQSDLDSAGTLHPDVSTNRDGGMGVFYYGNLDTGTYNTGERTTGDLISPFFFVPTHGTVLSFDTWEQTEDRFIAYDKKEVWYQVRGNERWFGPLLSSQFRTWSGGPNAWARTLLDVPETAVGECIRVRFRFDSVDEQQNDFGGWMVDNVEVFAPRAHATWNEVGRNPLGFQASQSPVIIGDELTGRQYAFTITDDNKAYFTCFTPHGGWGDWEEIPSPSPLEPGTLTATAYTGPRGDLYPTRIPGNIMIVANDVAGTIWYTGLQSTRNTIFPPAEFKPVAVGITKGKPALACDGKRFHLVSRKFNPDTGRDTPIYSHTNTLSGGWQPYSEMNVDLVDTNQAPDITIGFPDELDSDGALTNEWALFAVHIAWVRDGRYLHHAVKPELINGNEVPSAEHFQPRLGRYLEEDDSDTHFVSAPSMIFSDNKVQIAVQRAGFGIIYLVSNNDATWPSNWTNREIFFEDSLIGSPKLVEILKNPFIFSRHTQNAIKFYRVEANRPQREILQSGFLRGKGSSLFTTTSIEVSKSMDEIFVSGNNNRDAAGSYIWASRAIAEQTFDELNVTFTTISECRTDVPQARNFVPGVVNFRGECSTPGFTGSQMNGTDLGNNGESPRLAYPPALEVELEHWVSQTRFAAVLWTIPWQVWQDIKDDLSLEARLRGFNIIGRGSVNSNFFWLGYEDPGGRGFHPNLKSHFSFEFFREGFLEDEVTHPGFPPPAPWDTDLFEDMQPFDSQTSEDHRIIYYWIPYRLGDGDTLRGDRNDWVRAGESNHGDRYQYFRTMYGNQEFSFGRRNEPNR